MFHCIRMRMSTLNSKQFSLLKVMKNLPKRESTHANVHRCPFNVKKQLPSLASWIYHH